MSELRQEILDLLILNGRKPQTIKNEERVVYLYDALNIVNKEFSKVEQPTLNENQQIVLVGLKEIALSYNRQFEFNSGFKYAIRDLYYYLEIDYGCLENKAIVDMCESYDRLVNKELAQVLQAFSAWALEQEEE